jgi:inactive STAND
MTVKKSWEEFLNIVIEQVGIGKYEKTFLNVFKPCDPSSTSSSQNPCKSKGNNDYQHKELTKIYELFEKLSWGKFPYRGKAKVLLELLQQEYNSPCHISWSSKDTSNDEVSIENKTDMVILDAMLRDMNYNEQKSLLMTGIDGINTRKLFMVQMDGSSSRRWTTKRLSILIPRHDQSKGFDMDVSGLWNKNFDAFWKDLAAHFNDPQISNNSQDIIGELVRRCQAGPLIMAIHNIHDLEDDALGKLLTEFWMELLNRLEQTYVEDDHGKCILFLSTRTANNRIELLKDLQKECNIVLGADTQQTQVVNCRNVFGLPPWEFVTIDNMKELMQPPENNEFLVRCSGKNIETIKANLFPRCTEPPDRLYSFQSLLQRMCKLLPSVNLDELEKHWRLTV